MHALDQTLQVYLDVHCCFCDLGQLVAEKKPHQEKQTNKQMKLEVNHHNKALTDTIEVIIIFFFFLFSFLPQSHNSLNRCLTISGNWMRT